MGRMTDQPHNRFVFCVVVVEFAVNGNQALQDCLTILPLFLFMWWEDFQKISWKCVG